MPPLRSPWCLRDHSKNGLFAMGGSLSKVTQSEVLDKLRRAKSRRSALLTSRHAQGTTLDLTAVRDQEILITGYEELLRELANPSRKLSYKGKQ